MGRSSGRPIVHCILKCIGHSVVNRILHSTFTVSTGAKPTSTSTFIFHWTSQSSRHCSGHCTRHCSVQSSAHCTSQRTGHCSCGPMLHCFPEGSPQGDSYPTFLQLGAASKKPIMQELQPIRDLPEMSSTCVGFCPRRNIVCSYIVQRPVIAAKSFSFRPFRTSGL